MSMITSRNTRSLNAINTADFIVIRRGPGGISIEAHEREDDWSSVTVGSFDLDGLRATLDRLAATPSLLGSYSRTDAPDLLDVGVTAAAIEKETEDPGGPLDETADFWRSRWKEAADWADARDLAAHQWKETARRLSQERRDYRRDAKYEEARADALGRAHRECHAQRDEAWRDRNAALAREKAEQDRAVKAERAECPDLDAHHERYISPLAVERLNELQEGLDSSIYRLKKAEQERDEWKDSAIKAMADLERVEHPLPLTPDAITDEMVERARRRGRELQEDFVYTGSFWAAKQVLTAALTEPPARPEELTRLIDTIREATYDPEPVATGEALYNAGVRVVGEEQS